MSQALATLIRDAMEDRLGRVHVSVPGVIDSYDVATQRCSVTPQAFTRSGVNEIALPRLDDVPVAWLRGGGFVFTWPLQAGDVVDVRFSDRALDAWRAGQSVAPTDPRAHALADAVVVPAGVWPDARATPATSTTSLIIGRDVVGGACIAIKPDGTVLLGDTVDGLLALPLAVETLVKAQLLLLLPQLQQILVAVGAAAAAAGGAAAAGPAATTTAVAAVITPATVALTAFGATWPSTMATTRTKGV